MRPPALLRFIISVYLLLQHASNPLGSNFRLALIVPRRVYTDSDSQSSFRDLDLAPSAVLLVLPPVSSLAYSTWVPCLYTLISAIVYVCGHYWTMILLLTSLSLSQAYNTSSEMRQASPTAGPISYVLNLILSPLTFLWNSLQTLLFGNQPNPAVSNPPPAAAAPDSSARSACRSIIDDVLFPSSEFSFLYVLHVACVMHVVGMYCKCLWRMLVWYGKCVWYVGCM